MGNENMIDDINGKLAQCKSPKDVIEMMQNEGVELTDSQLEEISGGLWDNDPRRYYCPYCGSDTLSGFKSWKDEEYTHFSCNNCDRGFTKEQAVYK